MQFLERRLDVISGLAVGGREEDPGSGTFLWLMAAERRRHQKVHEALGPQPQASGMGQ